LLNRTTRSVSVTDAGLRLLERLRPAMSQITVALEDLTGAQAAVWAAATSRISHGGSRGDRAGLGALLVDLSGCPPRIRMDVEPMDDVAKDSMPGSAAKLGRGDMIAVRVMGR